MKRPPRGKTMRALTDIQLETLKYFYYGEAYIVKTEKRIKRGGWRMLWELYEPTGVRITARAESLFRRKLLKWGAMDDPTVYCTEAGIKEMEKIDA